MEIFESFRLLGIKALDFLFPPRCLACGQDVDHAGGVCALCFKQISFIIPPFCARCGLPFDFEAAAEAVCGACAGDEPPFHRARAALAYDAASRKLLIGLKHDRTHAIATLARWMRRDGDPLLAEADLVCPVPLHRWRLLKRGYNQAALLARAAAHDKNAMIPDLLLRRRATASQGGLSRSGRRRNVRGAFMVNPKWAERVAGKRVVVVDDVYTTGATLAECCRVLRKAGAARVDLLCAARVIAGSAPKV